MATRGITLDIPFIAWNVSSNVGVVGDALNITPLWWLDGSIQGIGTPTITEVSTLGAPGLYSVEILNTFTDGNIGVLHGVSSTNNVQIIPVTIQFERLPDAAPTGVGGVRDVGRINNNAAAAVNLAAQTAAIESGTVQASGANTVTLESNATTQNLNLINMVVVITGSATGRVQTRRITDYDNTTQVATVDRDWDVALTGSDEYVILGLIL